jgi:PAS domain S-box-containing protein
MYKELVEAIPTSIMLVDENGIIKIVNPAMERLSGYKRKELIGSPCTILRCDVCEIIKSEAKKKWCKLFEIGQVKGKRCVFMRKDGSYASVIKDAMIIHNKHGLSLGALECFADLAEIEKKELITKELENKASQEKGFHGIIGRHPVMERLFQLIEKAAESDAPVLIQGESGTGKELVAHAVHRLGRRRAGPFVKFNCAALNQSLLESELFGHTKGAFTGAYRHRIGRFEAANGGDIFLDEIGEIPLASQAKLLRVLDTKQFERVGDNKPLFTDVRVISATNKRLEEMASRGIFRQDLFYRINVLPLTVPPLRERRSDIPLLVESFLEELCGASGRSIINLSPEAMNFFMTYPWPGNVRELRSALEYAFVIAESGPIGIEHLPSGLVTGADNPSASGGNENRNPIEKIKLIEALTASGFNRSKAAEILGVHRMTVWNRMKKYGIKVREMIE